MMRSDLPLLSETALFLDFDGTLAPIQARADDVVLTPARKNLLIALASRVALGPIIISGRDLDDLSQRVPIDLYRIGNHGLRRALPGTTAQASDGRVPAVLLDALSTLLDGFDGCYAEQKSGLVAIHYRQAPDQAERLKALLMELPLVENGYSIEAGKMIYELKPGGANKGAALIRVMKDYPDLKPVMIGDDTTDEAAMSAAQNLGGLAIKVGPGQSVANIRVGTPHDLERYLKDWMSE